MGGALSLNQSRKVNGPDRVRPRVSKTTRTPATQARSTATTGTRLTERVVVRVDVERERRHADQAVLVSGEDDARRDGDACGMAGDDHTEVRCTRPGTTTRNTCSGPGKSFRDLRRPLRIPIRPHARGAVTRVALVDALPCAGSRRACRASASPCAPRTGCARVSPFCLGRRSRSRRPASRRPWRRPGPRERPGTLTDAGAVSLLPQSDPGRSRMRSRRPRRLRRP